MRLLKPPQGRRLKSVTPVMSRHKIVASEAIPRPDVVQNPDQLQEHASMILMAKDVARILEQHYPGWMWGINPDSKGRVLTISSFRVTNEWGYRINLMTTPLDDPAVRKRVVAKAGGEFLERFGIRPGPFSHEAGAQMTRYRHGGARPDLTDQHKSVQRHARDEAIDRSIKDGSLDIRIVDVNGKRHVWAR